jgi:hypothetical protein
MSAGIYGSERRASPDLHGRGRRGRNELSAERRSGEELHDSAAAWTKSGWAGRARPLNLAFTYMSNERRRGRQVLHLYLGGSPS